jgi:putative sterol carrier protein
MADQQAAEQFAEAVKGMSDEELAEAVKNLGYDATLKQIFDEMPNAFVPEKAAGVSSELQYDINTEEGVKQWSVKIADGTCTTSEGPASEPRLTLSVDLVNFIRLIFNQVDGTQLFMSGKLKLQGDMMFAMQMQTFFQRPS